MADQIEQAPLRVAVPVAKVYSKSISEGANDLPPAPDYNKLPTDQEVLSRTKVSLSGTANTNTNQNQTLATTPETKTEFDEDGSPIVTEEVEPTIEVVAPERNEQADVAKKEVAGEPIQDFKLDNEEDESFLKDLYKDEADNTIASKEVSEVVGKTAKVSEVDLEEKYKPAVEKARELDAIYENPLAKSFIEFVKSGKNDPIEFAKQAGFVNVEAMSDRDVIAHECAQAGLTPEQTELEYESFEQMTPLQKSKHIKSTKAELAQQRDEKLKAFTSGNEQTQKVYAEAAKIGKAQLSELIPKMENKKYEGLLITPEMAKSIEQYVIQHPEPVFKDGNFVGYDIKESVSNGVYKLFRPQLKKALVELGRSLGADKALTARIRPNKKVTTSSVIPVQKDTLEDVGKRHTDKLWEKRGVKPKK